MLRVRNSTPTQAILTEIFSVLSGDCEDHLHMRLPKPETRLKHTDRQQIPSKRRFSLRRVDDENSDSLKTGEINHSSTNKFN